MLVKIATWNVNSLRVRLAHLKNWLSTHACDIIGLQELKMQDTDFPLDSFKSMGYRAYFLGQKTYNGVAILVRESFLVDYHLETEVLAQNIPQFNDEHKRFIAIKISGLNKPLIVANGYFPNGQAVGSDKYQYKLHWLQGLQTYLQTAVHASQDWVLMGDFNIAPEDADVHDPIMWQGQVLVSEAERAYFQAFLNLGFVDSFRLFEQAPKSFSWWDYRQMGFRLNKGLRIDHILLSKDLSTHCILCEIDKTPRKLEQPSDHAPVVVTLDL